MQDLRVERPEKLNKEEFESQLKAYIAHKNYPHIHSETGSFIFQKEEHHKDVVQWLKKLVRISKGF